MNFLSNHEPTPKSQKVRHWQARSNLMSLVVNMLKLLPASFLAVVMTKNHFSELTQS